MSRPPTRYRRPACLVAVVVAGDAGSAFALAQSLPSRDTAPFNAAPDAGAAPNPSDGSRIVEIDTRAPAAPAEAGPISPPPAAPPTDDIPAFLHATVNQVDIGDVLVILRGNDVLVKVGDLESSGMRVE